MKKKPLVLLQSPSCLVNILSIPMATFFLTGCDVTAIVERTLTFEGTLSTDCLMQSAIAINAEFSEDLENLLSNPSRFDFTIRNESDDGVFRRASFSWNTDEVQSLSSSVSARSSLRTETILNFCALTDDFYAAVETECMLQPETTDLVDSSVDAARC